MENLNSSPKGERIHIGIFGKRNAGKSSLNNAITAQQLAIVSDIKGTTTDPVEKAMELLPLGPVVIIDTPGLDDEGELGRMRIDKAKRVLQKTDIALLVTDSDAALDETENELVKEFVSRNIPHIIVRNKCDITKPAACSDNEIFVSAKTGENIQKLKERIANIVPQGAKKGLLDGIVSAGDTVILVIPIDSAAPKGRLILPQQQVIRELLDIGAKAVVCRDSELSDALKSLTAPPSLVITDSQAFAKVGKIVPDDILLTSFSILFARYKGNLEELVKNVRTTDTLKEGDRVLIAEGCTHHRQCDDIGSVKIPRWIRSHTGINPCFEFSSGTGFPDNLEKYKMIIHCGGCMLNEREMHRRIGAAGEIGVPIVNYGILIAYINGILRRSLKPFPDFLKLLDINN